MTPVAAAPATANLVIRDLSKSFGGSRVLDTVSLDVGAGEIHGLLGHNGSGKSTLIKILSGVYAPDAGRVALGGHEIPLPLPPGDFNRYGIAVVHQALGLVPSLSVTENLLVRRLVREANPMIRWRAARREAAAIFAEYGLSLDPDASVSALMPVERALLAIVRAVQEILETAETRAGLLILDEPTPFLSRADVERLFALVRTLAARGTSVVFVSHDIDEIKEVTDRATVLRNGRVVASLVTKDVSKASFIAAIVGRSIAMDRAGSARSDGPPALRVYGLRAEDLPALDLTIGAGEVIGLTGLIGSGYDRIPYLLYGAAAADGGELTLNGASYAIADLTPGMAMRLGMVLVPADRQSAAVVEGLSCAENLSLPALGGVLGRLWITGQRVRDHAAALIAEYDIRPPDPGLSIRGFSGGNQQKVVLAKWLQTRPDIILLDEPTQGVDVGARYQVYGIIRAAASRGAAVVCASSDHEQLEMICDRVLIFNRGRIVRSLSGSEVTKRAITECCLGSLDVGPDRQPAFAEQEPR